MCVRRYTIISPLQWDKGDAFFDDPRIGYSCFIFPAGKSTLEYPRDFLHRPFGWHLESYEGHWGLDLILQAQHVMEKSDLLTGNSIRKRIKEKLIAHPYYIKCLVNTKGGWANGGKSFPIEGHGIFEQITFGR